MSLEFTAAREPLLLAIEQVMPAVDHNATLPILRHLLLRSEADRIAILGSNLETQIASDCAVEITEPGEIAIPAKKLHDILKNQPDGTLFKLRVTDERTTMTAAKGRFSVCHLPAADFPIMEQDANALVKAEIPQNRLKHLLSKTAFAMAKQDVRYYLNGLHLRLDGATLTATATDGHRLARASVDLARPGETHEGILNAHAVLALGRLLRQSEEPVMLILSERLVIARLPGATLTSKWVDGRYPNADRVIPSNAKQHLVIPRDDLTSAVKRCAILSNEKYRGIRLAFGDQSIGFEARNEENETASEQIEIDYQGEPITIGFNIAYLTDVCSAIDTDLIDIHLTDGNSSSLWRGVGQERETFVLMPMRM